MLSENFTTCKIFNFPAKAIKVISVTFCLLDAIEHESKVNTRGSKRTGVPTEVFAMVATLIFQISPHLVNMPSTDTDSNTYLTKGPDKGEKKENNNEKDQLNKRRNYGICMYKSMTN